MFAEFLELKFHLRMVFKGIGRDQLHDGVDNPFFSALVLKVKL